MHPLFRIVFFSSYLCCSFISAFSLCCLLHLAALAWHTTHPLPVVALILHASCSRPDFLDFNFTQLPHWLPFSICCLSSNSLFYLASSFSRAWLWHPRCHLTEPPSWQRYPTQGWCTSSLSSGQHVRHNPTPLLGLNAWRDPWFYCGGNRETTLRLSSYPWTRC